MNSKRFRKKFSIFKGTNKNIEILFVFGKYCPYELSEGDKLILTVLDYRNNDEIVIQKEVTGDNIFSFIPSDTEELDVGFYRYNVKFIPEDTEDIYEVIAPSTFHIEAGE